MADRPSSLIRHLDSGQAAAHRALLHPLVPSQKPMAHTHEVLPPELLPRKSRMAMPEA